MAKKVDDALTDLVRGKITRRVFIERLVALGVAMPVIGSLLKANAALAAESPYPITGDMALPQQAPETDETAAPTDAPT